VGRLEVAEENVIIESGSVFRVETVDVFLGKEKVAEIENFEVTGEKLFRDLVVQRVVGVMPFLEETTDRKANLFGIRFGKNRLRSPGDEQ
jgi:hypothetical protein